MSNTNGLAAKHEGLDLASLGSLASMLDTPVTEYGKPQMFDLNLIDEDPDNPRTQNNPGFSKESLTELAATMGERGIKSPVSLRSNPNVPGRFYINHGHRRCRAAKIAALDQVPGFLDENFNKFDQMIENIQRENLTARETADFIGSEFARGKTLTDIARLLGKSKAFVSQHAALLNLPDPVADAFHEGGIKDVTLVNELARAYKENPEAVEQTLAEQGGGLAAKQLTRAMVKTLRKPKTQAAHLSSADDNTLRSMEARLSSHLETTVNISASGQAIQLLIHARDQEQFNDLLSRMGFGSQLDTRV